MEFPNNHIFRIDQIDRIDRAITQKISPLYFNRFIWTIMSIVSIGCSWIICFPSYLLLLTITGESGQIFFLLFCSIVTAELIQLAIIIPTRFIVKRPRPIATERFILYEQLEFLSLFKLFARFGQWNRYSFPSLHTSRAFMLCIIIYHILFSDKSNGNIYLTLLIIGAIIVAVSRLVLQKHFLSDVIVGAVVGIFASLVTIRVLFIL